MFQTLKKFFAFCGVDNRRLFITSIWLGVVSAICSAMRIPAAAIVIRQSLWHCQDRGLFRVGRVAVLCNLSFT